MQVVVAKPFTACPSPEKHITRRSVSNKITKWRKWVDLICRDCGNIMLSKDMFLDLHAMIAKNPRMQCSDYFHEYMEDTYVAHVAMMLRKHIKMDRDSISLKSLATDILANQDKAKTLSSPQALATSLSDFVNCVQKVESFADRVVAHRDRRPPPHTPTFTEINEAIDAMDRLSVQCSLVVGGDYSDSCKPTVQYGWLRIFREMGIET